MSIHRIEWSIRMHFDFCLVVQPQVYSENRHKLGAVGRTQKLSFALVNMSYMLLKHNTVYLEWTGTCISHMFGFAVLRNSLVPSYGSISCIRILRAVERIDRYDTRQCFKPGRTKRLRWLRRVASPIETKPVNRVVQGNFLLRRQGWNKKNPKGQQKWISSIACTIDPVQVILTSFLHQKSTLDEPSLPSLL